MILFVCLLGGRIIKVSLIKKDLQQKDLLIMA